MPDFFKLLQQAQQMQTMLQQMERDLQQRTITGTAGGGLVTVEADGRGEVRKVSIDKSLVGESDVEMLEDLVAVAVNDVRKKAADYVQQEMGKHASGLDLK